MTFVAYIVGLICGFLLAIVMIGSFDGIAYMRKAPDGKQFVEHKGKMYWVTAEPDGGAV